MTPTLSLLLVATVVSMTTGMIFEQPMPKLLCDCFSHYKWKGTEEKADWINYRCISYYLARTYQDRWHINITESVRNYVDELERHGMQILDQTRRKKRQTRSLLHGIRKSYHSLSAQERRRFHRAVLAMKADTRVSPNAYEALANIHNENALYAAHFGPAFCPWHRYYLYLFENALRRYDASVTIPYLDSTYEDLIGSNTMNSILWTEGYLGNVDGNLRTGPFKNWRYRTTAGFTVPVTRNMGSGPGWFTRQCLQEVINHTRFPRVFERLETCHNYAHVQIGGTMNDVTVSPHDPIFFLHHCFIDYVWEKFRENSRRAIGNFYQYDYPIAGDPEHLPHRRMVNLNELKNRQGMSSLFTDYIYQYEEPTYSCTTTCPGDALVCVRGTCVPRTSVTGSVTNIGRKKRSTDETIPIEHIKTYLDQSYQNDFVIDGIADVQGWCIIPVALMYKRPIGTSFGCKPIREGYIDETTDIYSINNSSEAWNVFTPGKTKFVNSDSGSGATKIFLQADGITYKGRYIDYGIVDSRQIVSETIGYVGVKHPKNGPVIAYLSAYDTHGHVCQPHCIDESSTTLHYKKCSGVIKVTNEEPKMFGNDIGDAILYRYNFTDQSNEPRSRYRDQFIMFICDYREEYPWDGCAAI